MQEEDAAASYRGRRYPGRFVGIVALFAVLGPLLGALALALLHAVIGAALEVARGGFDIAGQVIGAGRYVTFIAGVPAVYTFGIVSAAGTGLAVAAGDRFRRGISMRVALASAAVLALIAAALAMLLLVPSGGLPMWIAGLLAAHMMAAALCAWIARAIFGGAGA